MKKVILLMFAITLAFGIKAVENPVFKWGAFLKTDSETSKGIASPVSVSKNAQNEVFVFGNYGSTFKTQADYTSKSTYYLYDNTGVNVFNRDTPIGASYGVNTTESSNSTNTNIYVYKLASNGEVEWQVASNEGDVYTSSSSMTTTQDGGVFLALKGRHTNSGENGNIMLRLIDDDGATTTESSLEYTISTYQGFLAKINSTGQVTNLIRVAAETNVAPNGFQFNSVVEDPVSGIIYLAGSFVVPLTFQKAGGGEFTIDPNFDYTGWNLDYTQAPRGYPFIVKLNAQGELLEDFTPIIGSGSASYSTFSSMDIDDAGNLYVYGNIVSAAGTTLTLKDKTITQAISSKYESFVAKITSSSQVEWLTHFTALASPRGGGRNKITSITYSNELNALFVNGSLSGNIGDSNQTVLLEHSNTATTLQGFILKIDATTGNYLKGVTYPAGGISESTATMFHRGNIYSVGYNMSVGQYLITYDENLENGTTPFLLMTAGTSPSSWDAIIADDVLLAYGRGRGVISFNSDPTISMTYTAYNSALAAYTLSSTPSSIEVDRDNYNNLNIYTSNGQIIVESAERQLIQIYNLYGQVVAKQYVEGVATFDIQAGVYIVNGKKVAVR